jgi:flagellar secretion chaperone FliS
MNLNQTELSYRKSAIEGASSIGLIIALFDTFAGDLRRAAAAIRKSDIEKRCKELNHASLVLGQLESWVDKDKGGDSAQTLAQFYGYLRATMMETSVSQSATLLETQIDTILQVRSAWQKLDNAAQGPPGIPSNTLVEQTTASTPMPESPMPESKFERIPFSQSG